jgi:putative ABC transport system permease protein
LSKYLGHKTVITILRGINLPIPSEYFIPLVFLGIVIILKVLLDLFLHTEIGLTIRATGDNEQMIRAEGVNADTTKLVGLSLSNALVALSGGLFAQYQGFADVGMGIGMIIAGLASVIIGEALIRGRTVGLMTLGAIVGAIIYRLAIAGALKWGYDFGFRPTDLRLLTALLVIVILAFPYLRAKVKRIEED